MTLGEMSMNSRTLSFGSTGRDDSHPHPNTPGREISRSNSVDNQRQYSNGGFKYTRSHRISAQTSTCSSFATTSRGKCARAISIAVLPSSSTMEGSAPQYSNNLTIGSDAGCLILHAKCNAVLLPKLSTLPTYCIQKQQN